MIRFIASTCSRYISDLRFFHLVSGYRDFTKFGHRFQTIVRSYRRSRPTAKKSPMSTDMLRYLYRGHIHASGRKLADLKNWPAMDLGFFFLLRSSEMRPLSRRDVLLGLGNNCPFVTIYIRQSKNDQSNRGTFRTLYSVGSVLWPVKAVATFIATKRGNYADEDFVFDQQIA